MADRGKTLPTKRKHQYACVFPCQDALPLPGLPQVFQHQDGDRGTESTFAGTLQGSVAVHADKGAQIYTDNSRAYQGISHNHDMVKHWMGENVRGQAPTNEKESSRTMMKRAFPGTCYKASQMHLDCYTQEFASRHRIRDRGILAQTVLVAFELVGLWLHHGWLNAENRLNTGARG